MIEGHKSDASLPPLSPKSMQKIRSIEKNIWSRLSAPLFISKIFESSELINKDKDLKVIIKEKLSQINQDLELENNIVDLAERMGFHYNLFSMEYLSRLLASIVFFYITAYINVLASVCAAYRTPWITVKDLKGDPTGEVTLPDLGHDLVKYFLTWVGYHKTYGKTVECTLPPPLCFHCRKILQTVNYNS